MPRCRTCGFFAVDADGQRCETCQAEMRRHAGEVSGDE
jgi:predicted Zn-ribbon and HTH transcriptional regulator